MGNKKKQDKRRMEFLEKESVSIESFLCRFLGITDVGLMNAHLSHNDLKAICPNLKRTGFARILDDPELVHTGEVILVTDSLNNVVPYVNDGFYNLNSFGMSDVMDDSDWNTPELWNEKKEQTPNIYDYELKSLSIYQLHELMQIYSKSGQYGNYEVVRRELISREDSHYSSKKSKARMLKKEFKRHHNNDDDEF